MAEEGRGSGAAAEDELAQKAGEKTEPNTKAEASEEVCAT